MLTRDQSDRLTRQIVAASLLLGIGLAPADFAREQTRWFRDTLSNNGPSRADLERIERGYYEQLLDTGRSLDRISNQPVDREPPRFGNAFIREERLTTQVNDIREYVSRANLKRDVAKQVPWTTNSLGMRDLEYAKVKPPNTFRIGLAGDSIGMGWGVGDDEGFEPRLEAMLRARSKSAGGPNVELLNFAVPGHGPGQRWHHFSKEAWSHQPDLVIYESSPADPGWDERRLRPLLARNIGFDAPVYEQTLKSAHLQPGMSAEAYRGRLKGLKWPLLEGVYKTVASDCRARGIPCLWVLVPRVGKPLEAADRERLVRMANLAGFSAVVDASDAFAGVDMSTLSVGGNDYHPNSAGHERIARRLDQLLSGLPLLASLRSTPPALHVRQAFLSDRRFGQPDLGTEPR